MNILQQLKYNRLLLKFNSSLDNLSHKKYSSGNESLFNDENRMHVYIDRRMKMVNARGTFFDSISSEREVTSKLILYKYNCIDYSLNFV